MTYYLLVSASARVSIIQTFSFSYSKAYFKDSLTTIKSTMDITIMRVEASFFDHILEELITIIAEHLENETQDNLGIAVRGCSFITSYDWEWGWGGWLGGRWVQEGFKLYDTQY